MSHIYKSAFTGQSGRVYRILLNNKELTAIDLAKKLNITPHSIYRITDYLLDLGIIEKTNAYPAQFRAKPVDVAKRLFLMNRSDEFSDVISGTVIKNEYINPVQNEIYDISFHQNRDEHIDMLIKDVRNARFSIKHSILVLPVGIPGELMLEFANAIKRGVSMKIIAQEYTRENISVLKSYKHIGVDLRHESTLTWHLFLIDDQISYISMYNPTNKISQTGVRLVHKGINTEMQALFDKYWQIGIEPDLGI